MVNLTTKYAVVLDLSRFHAPDTVTVTSEKSFCLSYLEFLNNKLFRNGNSYLGQSESMIITCAGICVLDLCPVVCNSVDDVRRFFSVVNWISDGIYQVKIVE